MTKKVLGWAIETYKQVLTPPLARKENLNKALVAIPRDTHRCSKKKWQCFIGLLRITVPAIAGAHDMFIRIQRALRVSTVQRVSITSAFHDELNLWRHLIVSLAENPTHLWEIRPDKPEWIGATDKSLEAMGGVCFIPTREWNFWRLAMDSYTKHHLLTDDNPGRYLTINDIELVAYVAHLHFFALKIPPPLDHIHTPVDNMAAEGWAQRVIAIWSTSVEKLLREAVWITRQMHIHAFVKRITRIDKKEEDAASRLIHLTTHNLLEHFQSTSPQPSPWRLCLLLCTVRRWLHTILRMHLSPKDSPIPRPTRTPHPGNNGTDSADVSKYHPNSTA